MTTGPAMSRDEARAALVVGVEVARDLVAAGNRLLVTGDMGIANTTASAALVSAFTGASPEVVTGRGTGIDDAMLAHKAAVVRSALERHGLLGGPSRTRSARSRRSAASRSPGSRGCCWAGRRCARRSSSTAWSPGRRRSSPPRWPRVRHTRGWRGTAPSSLPIPWP